MCRELTDPDLLFLGVISSSSASTVLALRARFSLSVRPRIWVSLNSLEPEWSGVSGLPAYLVATLLP